MNNPVYAKIKEDIAEELEHNKKYLNDLESEPIEVSKTLVQKSKEIMVIVCKILEDDTDKTIIVNPMIGVSYELLIKAILLRKGLNIKKDNNITISFRDCRNELSQFLNNFNPRQIERILDVIDLVIARRNNDAHLFYSGFSFYRQPYQIFCTYSVLLKTFFPEYYSESDFSRCLEIFKVKDAIDYEEVFL
ncbi:MAG: hypothetical protein HY364_02790 [Candidatus Aenigmarchaeota archaeon]|nr:hypothetical protein [Candidatus Aenigmarchaeota archaeon]